MTELFREIVELYATGDDTRKAQIVAFCRNMQNYDYHLRQVEGKLESIVSDALKAMPGKD